MGLHGFAGSGEDARVWHIGGDEVIRISSTQPAKPPLLPAHRSILGTGRAIATPSGLARVLPLCAGGSVDDLIAMRGTLQESESLVVVDAIAAALTQLHGSGLVHLDVKPANILLSGTGEPILGDTQQVSSADGRAIARGTPPFTVPGMMATPATDWVALGRTTTTITTSSPSAPLALLPARLRDVVAIMLDGHDPRPLLEQLQIDSTIEIAANNTPIPRQDRPTIRFGPQPPAPGKRRPKLRAALPLGVVAAMVLAILYAGFSSRTPLPQPPPEVTWSRSRGELTVWTTDGPVRFALGQPGDDVAFADWNCDGTTTPAVIRGDQAFVFTSWPGDGPAVSTQRATSDLSQSCN